ncbi:MAG: OadG family protein [Bacteroidota bacterium]|jgi:Na+-transporting methylmalonyl-CoA/oxaloacetate decarboxylase gamma subunit
MNLHILLTQWDFAISLSVIGYLIVLVALMFLWLIYTLIPKLIKYFTRMYIRRKSKESDDEPENESISGEVTAAISAALYLYMNEQHDDESGKITIKEVSRKYSPWSSKIYGMRQPLNK